MVDLALGFAKVDIALHAVFAVTLVDLLDGVVPLETPVVVSHDTLDTELRCARAWSHGFIVRLIGFRRSYDLRRSWLAWHSQRSQ